MNYENIFLEKLEELKAQSLYRYIPKLDAGVDKYIEINGKRCLNLSSNNYLGLSNNRSLIEASKEAVSMFGCSSSASRIVTGNYSIYDELEHKVAQFKDYERCLIFGCGYVANLSVISAICDRDWVILSDKLNHASIIDGIRLSNAKHFRYKHNDMDHLEKLLKEHSSKKKLIVTDTVFSMDGDIAELKDIVYLSQKYGAMVMVDEAHATGIFGKGRGVVHELGLENDVLINMGTFSKALGSFGAYVCSKRVLIEYLINKARGFIFSTSLPPPVVAANLKAIEYVEENQHISKYLLDLSKSTREGLKKIGFDTLNSQTQIIPVVIGNREKLLKIRDALIEKGIYAAAIRPPTVPINTERLRLSLRADMTRDEVEFLLEAFKEVSSWI